MLLYGGAARAVDESGDTHDFDGWRRLPLRGTTTTPLPIVGGAVRVPRVLHLMRYERAPRFIGAADAQEPDDPRPVSVPVLRAPPEPARAEPRSRDPALARRQDSWENLVVSCRACNLKKGRRTPPEAGMALLRAAARPALVDRDADPARHAPAVPAVGAVSQSRLKAPAVTRAERWDHGGAESSPTIAS